MLKTKKAPKGAFFYGLQIYIKIYSPEFGAGNETRTRDPNLGKVVLYQLSYSRISYGCCQPDSSHLDNFLFGAGNETRTRDPNLGKVVLYQLSYSRVNFGVLVLLKLFIGTGSALYEELFFWQALRHKKSRLFSD